MPMMIAYLDGVSAMPAQDVCSSSKSRTIYCTTLASRDGADPVSVACTSSWFACANSARKCGGGTILELGLKDHIWYGL